MRLRNTPESKDYGDTFVKLGAGVPLTVGLLCAFDAISDDNLTRIWVRRRGVLPDWWTAAERRTSGFVPERSTDVRVDRQHGQYSRDWDNVPEFARMATKFFLPIYLMPSIRAFGSLRAFSFRQAKLVVDVANCVYFGSNGPVAECIPERNSNGIVWT